MAVYPVTATESVTLGLQRDDSVGWSFANGTSASIVDGMLLRATGSQVYAATSSVRELMRLQGRLSATGVYHILAPTQTVALATRLQQAVLVALAERLTLKAGGSVALAMKLIDGFDVSTGVGLQASINAALAATFGLSVAAVPGLGSLLRDGLAIGDGTTWLYTSLANVVETVLAAETWTRAMTCVVIEQDGVTIDDASSLQMLFNLLVREGLWVGHEIVDPAGGLTTWAMNARSGAISEYRNWPFGSYARYGDTYLAASMDGLYELVGDRDQLAPIVALVGKELVEMTGSHLTGLGAAYVAMRTRGGQPAEVFLKLKGGRMETLYQFTAARLRTARVDLGKGWRTRYLSWELQTVGDDFDLTGLEFTPIQFVRRTP